MINGVINIYKEAGFTSMDAVAKLRGIVKQKKIGHTGTLDPAAEGVLPVCLGTATKLCELITDWDKTYETVMLLGRITDTQDTTGEVLSEMPVSVDEAAVREAIASFEGDYNQVPPMYSALKVDGKKLYELAREGREVERQARPVHIFKLDVLEINLPRVRMRVTCSKGTYIRTLCHDIGEKLGCGGCMEQLLRARVGHFSVEQALKLHELDDLSEMVLREMPWYDETVHGPTRRERGNGPEERVRLTKEQLECFQEALITRMGEKLVAVEDIFPVYAKVFVKPEGDKLLLNGNPFTVEHVKGDAKPHKDPVRVYDSKGCFLGIYQYVPREHRYKPIKMFLEKES